MSDPNQEQNDPVYIPAEPIEPVFPADRIEKGEQPIGPDSKPFPLENGD